MILKHTILAVALLAVACATEASPMASHVAPLERSCREDLSAAQCRCYANRVLIAMTQCGSRREG